MDVAPIAPYTLLFDEATDPGLRLPADLRAIYGGDWPLPTPPPRRPYTYTNFVVSHDGRISFGAPHHASSRFISRHAPHDIWLMALLRARADAILIGGATLRAVRGHRWTPWATFPAEQARLSALRETEGRSPLPLLVIISASGDLPGATASLRVPGQSILIATTTSGEARARTALSKLPDLAYHVSPGEGVNLVVLMAALREEYGVGTLLSEGGAHVYGALLHAKVIDEVFTTSSPIVVGNHAPPAAPRPSLVEGVAFSPDDPPRLRLLSLRRHGDYLFQRARFNWADQAG